MIFSIRLIVRCLDLKPNSPMTISSNRFQSPQDDGIGFDENISKTIRSSNICVGISEMKLVFTVVSCRHLSKINNAESLFCLRDVLYFRFVPKTTNRRASYIMLTP